MDKNDFRTITEDDVTYNGRRIGTFDSKGLREMSIDKLEQLLVTDMTYTQMSKATGMSVYEIRRYTGSIQ